MRILALLFALIGALGSGLMGFAVLQELNKKVAEAEADNAKPGGAKVVVDPEELKQVRRALYGMISGVPLGVIGGYLAMARKGKLAALLLVITYVFPLAIFKFGTDLDLGDERARPIFFFPAGFLVAAFFSLFIRSWQPPSRRYERGIDKDTDMVG